jgi:hypothetical protein
LIEQSNQIAGIIERRQRGSLKYMYWNIGMDIEEGGRVIGNNR